MSGKIQPHPMQSLYLGPQGNTDITLRIKANADGSQLEFREDILGVNYRELSRGKEGHLRAGKIDTD